MRGKGLKWRPARDSLKALQGEGVDVKRRVKKSRSLEERKKIRRKRNQGGERGVNTLETRTSQTSKGGGATGIRGAWGSMEKVGRGSQRQQSLNIGGEAAKKGKVGGQCCAKYVTRILHL